MGTTSRRCSTVARAVLAVGVTLAAVGATPAPATADPLVGVSTSSQAQQAASWLATMLTSETDGVFNDPAITAEAVLALTATGTEDAAAERAVAWLVANAPAVLGDVDQATVSAYGELAFTAVAAGADPSDMGGRDLLQTLRDLECGPGHVCDPDLDDPADELGRFADAVHEDDRSDVSSQAWAILALERAFTAELTDEGASDESVRFLLHHQCPDGGFPSTFLPSNIWTTDDSAPTCVSDPLVTGLVVQTLILVGENCDAVSAAVAWLLSSRDASGGWTTKINGSLVVNAYATARAAQALTAAGEDTTAAREFLTSLQEPDGSLVFAPGIDALVDRSTSRAVPALAEQSFATLGDDSAAPATYVCGDPEPTEPTPTPTTPTPTTTTTPTTPTTPTPTTTTPTPTVTGPTRPGLTSTISNRTGVDGGTDLTSGGTELARTGAMSWPLAFTGTGLLVAGLGLVMATRRREGAAQA